MGYNDGHPLGSLVHQERTWETLQKPSQNPPGHPPPKPTKKLPTALNSGGLPSAAPGGIFSRFPLKIEIPRVPGAIFQKQQGGGPGGGR